jgi:hypothetical protein
MTPSTGERRPTPPPPSPPIQAGGGFRPACLAYKTLIDLRHQQLPAASGNAPARKMAYHSPQLHHGTMEVPLYWRQGASSTDHPSTAAMVPLYWRQGASSTDHPSTATAAAPNPAALSRGGKHPPHLHVTSLYSDRPRPTTTTPPAPPMDRQSRRRPTAAIGHHLYTSQAESHRHRREAPTAAAAGEARAGLSLRRQHLLPPPDPPERASIALPPDPAGAPPDPEPRVATAAREDCTGEQTTRARAVAAAKIRRGRRRKVTPPPSPRPARTSGGPLRWRHGGRRTEEVGLRWLWFVVQSPPRERLGFFQWCQLSMTNFNISFYTQLVILQSLLDM